MDGRVVYGKLTNKTRTLKLAC